MKKISSILALSVLSLSVSAKAEFVELPQDQIQTYKTAVSLQMEKKKDLYCERTGEVLGTGGHDRFQAMTKNIISRSTKVLLDTSATSPAVIFQYTIDSESYSEVAVYTTPDQKEITTMSTESKSKKTVNKGSLVAPELTVEYVTVGSLKNCRLQ